jgi:hypothetical protein
MRLTVFRAGAGRLIGRVDADHLLLGTACVRVVDERQFGHGSPDRAGVRDRRNAEGLVPAEGGPLKHDGQRLRGEFCQHHGEGGGPSGFCGVARGNNC